MGIRTRLHGYLAATFVVIFSTVIVMVESAIVPYFERLEAQASGELDAGEAANLPPIVAHQLAPTARQYIWRVMGLAALITFVTMVGFSLAIERRLIRRLIWLEKVVRDVETRRQIPPEPWRGGDDEVHRLRESFNGLLERMDAQISESNRARKELAESESRFRAIFEASPVTISINRLPSMEFVAVNPEFLSRSKVTLEEVLGRTPAEAGLASEPDALSLAAMEISSTGRIDNVLMEVIEKGGSPGVAMVCAAVIQWNGEPCALSMALDVTQQVRMEHALAKSEETLRLIVEQTGHIMYEVQFATGDITWTGAVQELLGDTLEEFQAVNLERWGNRIHPEDQPESLRLFREAVAQVGRYDCVYRFARKDRGYVTFEDIGQVLPGKDGQAERMVGVMRDITRRLRAEQALVASEHRFHTLFETASDGIMLLKDSVFVDCNSQACEMFGLPRGEIVGRSPGDVSPALQTDGLPSSDKALALIADAQAGQPQVFEWQHLRAGMQEFTAEVKLNSVLLDDEVYVQAIVRDVTERKRVEARMRQAQKLEAVGLLAGGVAHDFNNLLQAMTSCGHLLLLKGELSDAGRSLVEEMLGAAERAANLTRQLLTFSRRQVIDPKPQNLNDIIQELARMLRRLIGEHVSLEFHPSPLLPFVRADRGQLEQVLINLCINARDAMPQGGNIEIHCEPVDLHGEVNSLDGAALVGRYVLVTVSDTGCGLDATTAARVFEPFFTTKEHGQGTGLGLATVHGIVQQHEGAIAVESQPGQGTSFRIWLPAMLGANESPQETHVDVASGGHESILLAEDEEHVRKLTAEILETAGYRVLCAVNGKDALELFERERGEVDLLLFDVVMPVLGGPDVLQQLRARGHTVPCIFASGYSESDIHQGFVLANGVNLLQKPYTLSELLLRVRSVLDAAART